MAVKIINKDYLDEVNKNAAKPLAEGAKESAYRFSGTAFQNLKDTRNETVTRIVLPAKVANQSTEELRRDAFEAYNAGIRAPGDVVENSGGANSPSYAAIEAFFGKFFLDLQRTVKAPADLTTFIAREITDFGLPETVNARDVEPFRGAMGTVTGEGDAVPLIQQNTGNLDTFGLQIKAVGWKSSLKNVLFNPWYSMEKVIQAAKDADVDERNNQTAGAIVSTTYAASQKQCPNTDTALTIYEKRYQTLADAIKTLRGLKDIYTKRKIAIPQISLLCNSIDTWDLQNIINGQLDAIGGGARGRVQPTLPINNIVEFDQGINDGFTINKKVISYPGVTPGKCYLFVPGVMIVANKRPLTLETERGNILDGLTQEESAWYRIMGTFGKQFFGTSFTGSSCGAGYGYVVEVTLP